MRIISALLLCILVTASHAGAVEKDANTRELLLVRIIDAAKPEYIFIVGEVGFRSVAGLKDYVASLPDGTTLRWAPGCLRFGDEPVLSKPGGLEEFRRYCASQDVKLVVVPSG